MNIWATKISMAFRRINVYSPNQTHRFQNKLSFFLAVAHQNLGEKGWYWVLAHLWCIQWGCLWLHYINFSLCLLGFDWKTLERAFASPDTQGDIWESDESVVYPSGGVAPLYWPSSSNAVFPGSLTPKTVLPPQTFILCRTVGAEKMVQFESFFITLKFGLKIDCEQCIFSIRNVNFSLSILAMQWQESNEIMSAYIPHS